MTRTTKYSSTSQNDPHQRRRRRQQRSKKFQSPKLSQPRNHASRKYANSTCQTGPHTSNELLHTTYTTPSEPGSFSAVQNLKRYTGKSYNKINRYLSDRDAYTLHKQRRIHFPRRKTYSKGIGDLYQADLVDLSNISRYNDCYRYLLTVIDVFSKMAWVVPLLSKSARHLTDAFEKNTSNRSRI